MFSRPLTVGGSIASRAADAAVVAQAADIEIFHVGVKQYLEQAAPGVTRKIGMKDSSVLIKIRHEHYGRWHLAQKGSLCLILAHIVPKARIAIHIGIRALTMLEHRRKEEVAVSVLPTKENHT